MKLIVYAGREFKADFTVVSADGVTGEVLDPTDTATFSAQTSGPNPESILKDVPMTLIDADNGLFELNLTTAQTSVFKQYIGFQEDCFNPICNHTGYLDFILVSGDRQATVSIAVKEIV